MAYSKLLTIIFSYYIKENSLHKSLRMPTNFPDAVVPCINTVISENFIMLSKTLLGVIAHVYNSKTLKMRQEAHKLDAILGHIGRHVLNNKKVLKAVIMDTSVITEVMNISPSPPARYWWDWCLHWCCFLPSLILFAKQVSDGMKWRAVICVK